jgi:hypothetical protein
VPKCTQYSRLIELVCKTRGLHCDIDTLEALPRDHFEIRDRSCAISGFWPAVEYLTTKYPEPELLLGDVTSRCVTRSLVNDMLAMGKVDGIFLDALKPDVWRGQFPVGGIRPSLLDLAYIAVLGDCGIRDRLTGALDQFIARLSAEAA